MCSGSLQLQKTALHLSLRLIFEESSAINLSARCNPCCAAELREGCRRPWVKMLCRCEVYNGNAALLPLDPFCASCCGSGSSVS